MPLYKTIAIAQGLIGIWQLSETTNDLLAQFSETELPDTPFTKYTHGKRQAEWLATRLLLKEMIGNEFSITYLPSGKPVLSHPVFSKISITHSRDFVGVIVHESKNIGIDIEDTTRDFKRIEKRFLSEEELKFSGDDAKLKCLYWCVKEAVFKLAEEEGIEFREQIRVTQKQEYQNQFQARFITPSKDIVYTINFEYFSENCMVWVVE